MREAIKVEGIDSNYYYHLTHCYSSSVHCKCLFCDMVMDELLKVKEAVVRHPIFVIGSAVWMLADMTLDIVSVLGYRALSEEVWIIKL